MAPILELHKITIPGNVPPVYYYANPKTYQGLTVGQVGVAKASDAEKAVNTYQHAKDLLSNPYLCRAVIYIKKANGRRTSRALIMPRAKFATFAIFIQGKPITTASGDAGTVVSLKDVRHRSRK